MKKFIETGFYCRPLVHMCKYCELVYFESNLHSITLKTASHFVICATYHTICMLAGVGSSGDLKYDSISLSTGRTRVMQRMNACNCIICIKFFEYAQVELAWVLKFINLQGARQCVTCSEEMRIGLEPAERFPTTTSRQIQEHRREYLVLDWSTSLPCPCCQIPGPSRCRQPGSS